jgi:hypothetical protein
MSPIMNWKLFRRRSRNRANDVKSSLRRRYVFSTGAVAIVLLIVVTGGGSVGLGRAIRQQQNAVLSDAARRSALSVDRALAERFRQVDLMAWDNSVIQAAKEGAAISRSRGLPSQPIPVLEERFRATRSRQVDSISMGTWSISYRSSTSRR